MPILKFLKFARIGDSSAFTGYVTNSLLMSNQVAAEWC